MKYTQTPAPNQEIVDLLVNRGLDCSDKNRCLKYLQTVGYFRITVYMFHLKEPGTHQFKAETRFDDIILLYKFDKRLRYLLSDYLERLEIAMRSYLNNSYALKYGFYWYLNESLYDNKDVLDYIEKFITEEMANPSEQYLKKFVLKYTDEKYPPSNMAMELLSFGKLSKMYEGLKNTEEKQAIASSFGLTTTLLSSWLISLTHVRNICAHHARLWNRNLTANRFIIPSRAKYKFNGEVTAFFNQKVYGIVSILIRLLYSFNPLNTFSQKLAALLDEYPTVDVSHMGFPINWKENPAWGRGK